jgi:hypothetical protein
VSETLLVEVLTSIARNFDESPTRMHAVLSAPGKGVRWMTFACTAFQQGYALAEGHFTDSLMLDLPELIVVAMSRYGSLPYRADVYGPRPFNIILDHGAMFIHQAALPEGARHDGDVDEIALGALGLPITRPFDAIAKPTHEFIMRADRRVPTTLAITKLDGPTLPIRVHEHDHRLRGEPFESFPKTDRRADSTDAADLRALVDKLSTEIEKLWVQKFDAQEPQFVARLASHGPAIIPALVEILSQPRPRPRTSRVCLAALARLNAQPDVIFDWVNRGRALATTAYAALARLGETARPVYESKSSSKTTAERAAAETMLAFLDNPRYAELRGLQRARASLTAAERAEIEAAIPIKELYWLGETFTALLDRLPADKRPAAIAYGIQWCRDHDANERHTMHVLDAGPDALWPYALDMLESPPFSAYEFPRTVESGSNKFGESFGPVADVLLSFPTMADDSSLQRVAAGGKALSISERIAENDKKRAAKKRAAKREEAAPAPKVKGSTAKKPIAKKPAAKKPATKMPVAKKPAAKKPAAKMPATKTATATKSRPRRSHPRRSRP